MIENVLFFHYFSLLLEMNLIWATQNYLLIIDGRRNHFLSINFMLHLSKRELI